MENNVLFARETMQESEYDQGWGEREWVGKKYGGNNRMKESQRENARTEELVW